MGKTVRFCPLKPTYLTFMPIFAQHLSVRFMKRLFLFLILRFLQTTAGIASPIDSLYHCVMTRHSVDFRAANQLFVMLDAEGVTDSLVTVNPQDGVDAVRQRVCYNMGLFYNATYKHRLAAAAFTQAALYAGKVGDERDRAEALSAAAVQHHLLGDFEKAIRLISDALHTDSVLHDAEALSCDLNILSGSSLSAGRTDDAVRYILKAIEWEKARPEPSKLAIRYGSAAEILNKKGDTESALHYATLAYELDHKAGNAVGMARRMSQMADIYVTRKDYVAAERHYRRAIDTLEAHRELHSLSIDYRLLAKVLTMQGKHAAAIPYYEKAEALARQTGNRFFLSLVARSRAESERTLGHYELATNYLELALQLSDSLHSENQEQMSAELRTQFEMQELGSENERNAALMRWQQWIIAALLCVLLGGIVVVILGRRKRMRKAALAATAPDAPERAEAGSSSVPTQLPEEGKKAGDKLPLADRQFLVSLSDFVHANMKSRKITIDLIAEEFCMSRNQFVRRLTAITGETPGGYIARIKMEKAVRLLRHTEKPVKEVAYECGFDESNYFIHVFRQAYGMTPQQFRQTPEVKKGLEPHDGD